jgi:LysR family transcriptional regulator, hydrogen peroxide-inducible genes activator
MNFQQLQYIVALDDTRHFARAAAQCYVSQPTLSAMVRKLEDELGAALFDRDTSPVQVTALGEAVVAQSRLILAELDRLKEIVSSEKEGIRGKLRIGIIPTVAPFLLPLFLGSFIIAHPGLELELHELTTRQILRRIERRDLDAGIMAIPLPWPGMRELPLYEEPFLVYSADPKDPYAEKNIMAPRDIDRDKLWLLEEGHCLREQVVNLCELQRESSRFHNLKYEAGSIDSLKRIVDANQGITILPSLATVPFSPAERERLRSFVDPVPVRQIGLVVSRYFVRDAVLSALSHSIVEAVQPYLKFDEKNVNHLMPVQLPE